MGCLASNMEGCSQPCLSTPQWAQRSSRLPQQHFLQAHTWEAALVLCLFLRAASGGQPDTQPQ